MTDRPNVLLFFTDDQRFDTIAALGNDRIATPNLDALVRRGTTFTHAHIPGGTSGAVCMPSRAMLHTGRTLFRIDGAGQEIPTSHITIGEAFRSAGYVTFGTGKWHNARSSYARSFSAGDEIFLGGMGDHWNVPAYRFDPTGKYSTRAPFITGAQHSNSVALRDCDHIEAGKHSTDLFVDASIRFLEDRRSTEPFFMYVSLMAPHDPRSMPGQYLEMYDPETIPLPDNFLAQHPIDTGALRVRDELLAEIPRRPPEIRRHIAEYYAMISHLDAAFGRLLTALDEAGETDNTIIVFAGDNGLALGQHGLMGKQNLYDHSVRVPLIFAGPGISAGSRCDSLAYLMDIFPTLCDLTGIEVPPSVESNSLLPCLKDPDATVREHLYLAYIRTIRGVTNGRYKLIEYACGATQLFDLSLDPQERNNLAAREESASLLASMRKELLRLAMEWDDHKSPYGADFWACRTDLTQLSGGTHAA